MSRDVCAVEGCDEAVKARHLCPRHYRLYQANRLTEPHTTLAGFLAHPDPEDEPLVCICLTPIPDAIGACAACGRLVVTYARANREVYRDQWPTEWHRAVQLSLFPALAPDITVAER